MMWDYAFIVIMAMIEKGGMNLRIDITKMRLSQVSDLMDEIRKEGQYDLSNYGFEAVNGIIYLRRDENYILHKTKGQKSLE